MYHVEHHWYQHLAPIITSFSDDIIQQVSRCKSYKDHSTHQLTSKPRSSRPSWQQSTVMTIDPPQIEAAQLAGKLNAALLQLTKAGVLDLKHELTDGDLLALPFDKVSIDQSLEFLPRHYSTQHEFALEVAGFLYPAEPELTAIDRYEKDRKQMVRWIKYSRRYATATKTRGREERDWRLAIQRQGLWQPMSQPISLDGPPSLPMPVEIASAESLKPFFTHLRNNGTADPDTIVDTRRLFKEITEPYYGTAALEFPRGVVYEDGRMDLCKQVVGPTNIGTLMESLKSNGFIKHFLLGNNIIGPEGAREIGKWIFDRPDQIDTWYLAGNAIHGVGFTVLVDALSVSPAVTNVWLKRNPLGAQKGGNYVADLYKLITATPNLRTLDLDQTELGDDGVARLFDRLKVYAVERNQRIIKLENLYLNGNGIGVNGARAIGKFLALPNCSLKRLYMSNNPLGNAGVHMLIYGVLRGKRLEILCLQSVGMGDQGVDHAFETIMKLVDEGSKLRVLDVGTSYATKDLGQAYNALTPLSARLIDEVCELYHQIEYLDLGAVLMPAAVLTKLFKSASKSRSLLYFNVLSAYHHKRDRETDSEYKHYKQLLKETLTANVQRKHGPGMTYEEWCATEKRWLLSDEMDVRKIDSVYRTRDMGLARRGLMKLDKWWTEENEGILAGAMGSGGPVSSMQ